MRTRLEVSSACSISSVNLPKINSSVFLVLKAISSLRSDISGDCGYLEIFKLAKGGGSQMSPHAWEETEPVSGMEKRTFNMIDTTSKLIWKGFSRCEELDRQIPPRDNKIETTIHLWPSEIAFSVDWRRCHFYSIWICHTRNGYSFNNINLFNKDIILFVW